MYESVSSWFKQRRSGLLRHGRRLAVDGIEDPGSAALQQRVADLLSERHGIAAALPLAEDERTIRLGDDGGELDAAVLHFGKRANRYLTTPAEPVEQSTLAGCGRTRRSIVEKSHVLTRLFIAGANLDTQGALTGGRTHVILGHNLFHQLRLAEPRQARGSQDDGVVCALFQLA